MYILNTLILLSISAVLYVYWFFKKAHKLFDQCNIPNPKPHWFFGNMKDVVMKKKTIWDAYRDVYEQHPSDRFFGVYSLHTPTVVIRDPELIKTVLVKDFSHFHDRGLPVDTEAEPMSRHLLNMAGDEWKNLRIKLTSTFTSGKMKMMFPLLKKCAEDIKPVLTKCYQDGEDFEAKDFFARYATDVIGSCAFGVDTHSIKDPHSEFRQVGKSIFKMRWQALLRMFFPKIPTSMIKRLKLQFLDEGTCQYFQKIVRDMVKCREENNITRGDFLDILIAMKNHTELEKLKDQQAEADLAKFMAQIGNKETIKSDVEMSIELMAAQCFIFFVAGFEGASNLLMFSLFSLAENPHIQIKLRKEILSALESNGGELSYEIMKNIPYLDMVIDETFRKFPSGGSLLFRTCTENYKIPDSNAVIKKGTQVIIPAAALQTDKKYFEKPDEFYPEHFSAEAKKNRHHFAFLPFGEGPRVCIAERFARMQVIVGLIYLLKDFSFELSPKTKVPLEYDTTGAIAVKGGIWLKCRPLLARDLHSSRAGTPIIMYITLSTLFLIIVTGLLYIYWFLKQSHKFFDQYGIPYPKPHWLFGNMKDMILCKKVAWLVYKDLYDKHVYDRFIGVYTLHKPTVMIRDPELIKSILVKDFSHFRDRGFPVNKEAEPLGDNLFSMTGDEWKNLRIKLTSTFSSGKMKMMFPLLKRCAEDIEPALKKYIEDGQDFEAKDLAARYATDVIGSCAFGIDIHSLQNPESEFRKIGKTIFKLRWQLFARALFPKLPTSVIKYFKLQAFSMETCDYFSKLVTDVVKYREENNVTRGDFLDILIAMKNHKDLEKLKDQQDEADLDKFMAQIGLKTIKSDVEMTIELMVAQCFLFFIGGFDGASTTLMLLLFEMAQNPDIQTKLRQEIISTIESNGGELTYDMMKKMPYLEMVLSEVWRKHPAGPIIIRECTENYRIPGTDAVIKKGIPVLIPSLALQLDKKYFEKPDQFYPEHFTVEAKRGRHPFVYLPFGEGPRVCIAERFARMQVFVGAVYLLKDFAFELSSKTKVPLEFAPGGPIIVKGGVWLKCRTL
ncbi:uncharacterized protein LOC135836046 [Planococcus citri]|uniref:uncharacterized protein LOC135836046 n=1 Tax=Planococcus citri TaxID=170843 RepID=UPI0031F87D58